MYKLGYWDFEMGHRIFTEGLIMCSKKKTLALELRDLSQAEKETTACKAEKIHKMTTIFTQNHNQGPF